MKSREERPSLLLEIVCEEIPARSIASAARELHARVAAILDAAGLPRGEGRAWGGSRRLAVRFASVAAGLPAREEEVLGPPASVAFGAGGAPTAAGAGFARKQGVDPSRLGVVRTAKGEYAGFRREVPGRTLEEILKDQLASAVSGIPFPKTMRWGAGTHRWVRPVHALVALHGVRELAVPLFDVVGGRRSLGHRFRAPGFVTVAGADAYEETLRAACVLVDPDERRSVLARLLIDAAAALGGEPVPDDALLGEISELVEWPGIVAGSFDAAFLALPRELLVTTLRHHQKSFSIQRGGDLLPAFLSVANSDSDPAGHIRRGNEWVVSGRLEDARFFWSEDRKRPLASRVADLDRVTFHAALGSYGDKTARIREGVVRLAARVGAAPEVREAAARSAALAKADLTTGLVGEFPELQGVIGGLLLRAEGEDPEVAAGVYEHYRPAGAEDPLPSSTTGSLVSAADRLDTIGGLIGSGERPTGSRDPFGLRRAANGVFRLVLGRGWPLSTKDLADLAGGGSATEAFLVERLENFLKDSGATANEVAAVLRAGGGASASGRPLPDLETRIRALRGIRDRADFAHLVDLVKRVANIRRKNADLVAEAERSPDSGTDPEPAVRALEELLERSRPRLVTLSGAGEYAAVIDLLAAFVGPVDRFFEAALVVDAENRESTGRRLRLLGSLEATLTDHFDIRALPGAADRST